MATGAPGSQSVKSVVAGDIVITRGGRPKLDRNTNDPGITAVLSVRDAVDSAQDSSQKQLTARELFYAAAQAPAAAPRSRPPAKARRRVHPHAAETPSRSRGADTGRRSAAAPAPGARHRAHAGQRRAATRLALHGSETGRATTRRPRCRPTPSSMPATASGSASKPTRPGYLYIINQGSSGTWKPMFPSAEVEDGNNQVEGWRPYTMPPKAA